MEYFSRLGSVVTMIFSQEGEFWRILLPGIYTMEVFADGFAPREVQFAIVEQNPTMLNITLYQVDSQPTPSTHVGSNINICSLRTLPDEMETQITSRPESPLDCFHSTLLNLLLIYCQSYLLLVKLLRFVTYFSGSNKCFLFYFIFYLEYLK